MDKLLDHDVIVGTLKITILPIKKHKRKVYQYIVPPQQMTLEKACLESEHAFSNVVCRDDTR